MGFLSSPRTQCTLLVSSNCLLQRHDQFLILILTGYAWFYGLSLIVGSYLVLFVSLAAHAAQFAFLVWFENPRKDTSDCPRQLPILLINVGFLDIERKYGQRKLLAERVPVHKRNMSSASIASSTHILSYLDSTDVLSTPSATEGETMTETETDIETEMEYDGISSKCTTVQHTEKRSRSPVISHHDLLNRYFRQDTIFVHNFDVFRLVFFLCLPF